MVSQRQVDGRKRQFWLIIAAETAVVFLIELFSPLPFFALSTVEGYVSTLLLLMACLVLPFALLFRRWSSCKVWECEEKPHPRAVGFCLAHAVERGIPTDV